MPDAKLAASERPSQHVDAGPPTPSSETAAPRHDTAPGYLPAIEGLRAVAVLSVIVFHLNGKLLPGGFVGVDIFFVISGFVVCGSMMGKRFASLPDLLAHFYARRILRIVPALLVTLIVTAFLASLFIPDAWLSGSMNRVGAAAFFGLSNVVLAAESDSYFSPRTDFNPYVHTWSLGVEEQFYFVFPFLMYWRQRAGAAQHQGSVALVAVLSLAGLALCAVLTETAWRVAFYAMPARFWELGAGMLLCLTMTRWRGRLAAAPASLARPLAVGGCLAIAGAFSLSESYAFPFPMALLPVLGTVALLALFAARPAGILATILGSYPAAQCGKRSYSLYLWHFPILVLFRWTVGLSDWAHAGVALGLVILLACLSYRFVEQPIRRHPGVAAIGPRRIVAFGLLGMAAAAAVGVAIMKAKPHLSLSTTRDARTWYADEARALPRSASACLLVRRDGEVTDGSVAIWLPTRCAIPPRAGRLFVIGDSHARAYNPMLRGFAAAAGVELRTYFATGCPFLELRRPMAAIPGCTRYYAAATDQLARELGPDDVLFLPSLRLSRLSDQWGEIDHGIGSSLPSEPDPVALTEARAVLRRLAARGARITFEAPLPIFRAPPFRCSDWFNRQNPVCAPGLVIARSEIEALRAPIVDALRLLTAAVPRAGIWDPLPTLCDRTRCAAATDAGPLFFDTDHLSGLGNDRLYPSFARHMQDRFDGDRIAGPRPSAGRSRAPGS